MADRVADETAPAAAAKLPAAPPAGSAIPVQAFARLPFIRNASLSPDGQKLAGLFGIGGQQMVAVHSLFDKGAKPVGSGLPEGTDASWVQWVNDENLIVGLRALQSVQDQRLVVSRIIGLNTKTGKITKILWNMMGQGAANVLWTASDGSPAILVAAQNSLYQGAEFWPAVYRVDVSTGKAAKVQYGQEGVMDWYADAAGSVRAGVSYNDDNRKFRLLYRGEGNRAFRVVDAASSRKQETLLSPFLFLPGGDHAMALHDDDKGQTAVYEVDMTTQTDVRQVHAAPVGQEIASVRLSDDGQTILGLDYSGTSQTKWLDPVLAAVQAQMDKAVGARRATIISMTADRSRLLVRLDRPDSPGALFYFDLANEKMQQIAQLNPDLGTRPLAPVRMVRYKARDGLEIEAVLTVPRGAAEKNLPIIMLPHGGPWANDTLHYDYWAQFLASRGYVVMQPNFRGSTGYGTAFVRAGEGQMGLAMQDDITDGLAWAVKQGIADPGRACIVGASYGGYAAMWGVAKDPALYRCAISIAGVANVRRDVNDFGSYLMGGKYKDDWKRMSADFAAVSPINAVDRITAPLLLVHGKKDVIVDFGQSQAMFNKARSAGKQVELIALPLADHSFTREADRLTLLQAMETFLAKHNPADTAAPAKP